MAQNPVKPTDRPLPPWLTLLSVALLAEGVLRYVYSGIVVPSRNGYWAVTRRQLWPLLELVWRGQPVAETMANFEPYQARYGPVTFLAAHPLALLTRADRGMELSLLLAGHAAFWVAVLLVDRRFFSRSNWRIRALFFGMAINFTPVLITMGEKAWNTLELMFVAIGLYLATSSSPRQRDLAAAPVAAGVLTKLTPLLVMASLVLRNKTAAIVGAVSGALILTLCHVLYGAPMGWGYLTRLPGIVRLTSSVPVLAWDNESLKGLVYRFINGFRFENTLTGQIVVDPRKRAIADVVLLVLTVAVLGMAIRYLWRWRPGPDPELERLRILGAFSLSVVLIMFLAPTAAMPHMCSCLLAFALLLRTWQFGLLRRSEIVMALVALLLIGNMVPNSVVVWMSGAPWLNRVRHSAPSLRPNETFLLYGWPGYGLALLTVTVVRLQWRLTRTVTALDSSVP